MNNKQRNYNNRVHWKKLVIIRQRWTILKERKEN